MSYKIVESGPYLSKTQALFSGTATDSLKKLETMKQRCNPNGRVDIYFNAAVISEEDLNQLAIEEASRELQIPRVYLARNFRAQSVRGC